VSPRREDRGTLLKREYLKWALRTVKTGIQAVERNAGRVWDM
jgi:hypothetical protein